MILLVYFFLAILSLLVRLYYKKSRNYSKSNKRHSKAPSVTSTASSRKKFCNCKSTTELKVQISYFGLGNTSKNLSEKLEIDLIDYRISRNFITDLNLDSMDFEVLILVISSYNTETEYDKFLDELNDKSTDFRVGSLNKQYCIVGIGDSNYEEFNIYVKKTEEKLQKLKCHKVYCNLLLDTNNRELKSEFEEWLSGLKIALKVELDSDQSLTLEKSQFQEPLNNKKGSRELVDLEELGIMKKNYRKVVKKTTIKKNSAYVESPVAKDMVTPSLYKSLTKQGYKVIGSHSGVKLCRWTKASMRGRGFCYKKAFYGIKSYLCMETTPSLACANKCVFCWRHHTNPVATKWKWNMDDPEFVLNGAITNHYKMIKEMRGVPGVINERFDEAFTIKHCALSLVGEPIMYPKINDFVDLLHKKNISTFLVTNAQFPQCIKNLKTVTQLYVSVDASTKADLKRIDRPLFKDFWERFIDSLRELKNKGQRTVYRLTLVKGYNVDEIESYVDLVKIGCPDFIEIKGVTYCGYSEDDELTMENVPYHQEVIQFSQKLVNGINSSTGSDIFSNYELSCEHAHSCSILIANTKFKINNQWHTWINYEKFNELYLSGQKFTSLEYCSPTPDWALYGSQERGFVPTDTRFYRKKKQ